MLRMKTLPLKAWVLKYHKVKYREYSLSVKEDDLGELKVIARDTSNYADLHNREQHVCDIPENLMLVSVPYLASTWTPPGVEIEGGQYIGEIEDMIPLQQMLDNIESEMTIAVQEVVDYLRN